jgi:hypothetical protein
MRLALRTPIAGVIAASAFVGMTVLVASSALAGCDATFRFDEPPGADGGEAGETSHPSLPCTSDATCAGLRCKTTTGSCVACLTDVDCSGVFSRCDVAIGVCVACLDAADCGARQRCDPTARRCLDTCHDADDPCPLPNVVCDQVRHLCIECRSSANCAGSAGGPVCDLSIGRCVECIGNAQCPTAAPVCDRRTGQCVGCVASSACVHSACDPLTLVCRPPPG